MINTIEQAIRPLLLISNILGLSVYTSKPYLNIIYNVIVWCIYSYFFYYIVFTFKLEEWFLAFSTLIKYGILFVITITSIIINFYQHERWQKFIKRLAAVDDTLEKLGTPKIYRTLYVYTKKVVIGWLLCTQIANIFDTSWFRHMTKSQWYKILLHFVNHVEHTNISDLIFSTCLWYIGTRFDKLNEHMRCLLLKEKHGERYLSKKLVPSHQYIMYTNNYKNVFWITMHLHLELGQLARELNTIFEVQLIMEIVFYLIHLTRLFRYVFIHTIAKDNFISSLTEWINVYVWVLLHIGRLFYFNYVCESVSAKSNEMNTIIHRLTDSSRYADIRNEIYQFTLQMIRHPLKLSGLGLFDFGNALLRKFIITIVTFLIIVIQMPGTSNVGF